MQSGCDPSRRGIGRNHVSGSLKEARDLNAEIHVHGRLHVCRMVIQEDVVAIRSESGMLLQERPHLVEGPPPGGGNLVETNRLADGRESSRRNQLNGNFSGHDAFSLRRGMSLGVVVGVRGVCSRSSGVWTGPP